MKPNQGIRRFIEKVKIRRDILLFLSANSVLRAFLAPYYLIIPRSSLYRGSTVFQVGGGGGGGADSDFVFIFHFSVLFFTFPFLFFTFQVLF